jgi:protoporphyrinogen oxidase
VILILGGGLAGLSTAFHLGSEPHLVLESETSPGGIARSRQTQGFVFDYTGHLLHLRDPRAVALIDRLLPGTFRTIERKAAIRAQGATLPFPFQANLGGLPREVVARCLVDFAETLRSEVPKGPDSSFRDWSLAVFGRGISEAFMFPYNCKLFRRLPEEMTADWVSWAVPKPTLEEVIRGALGVENRGLGYNATFRYPQSGGIGVIAGALARGLTSVRCGAAVRSVDLAAKRVGLESGESLAYDELVVTIPLPRFLEMARGSRPDLADEAKRLDWSVVACLNLGVGRAGVGKGAHWIYFPDPDVPFYRVGFPTAFSDGVAPPGQSSMYVEIGLRKDETPDWKKLEGDVVAGLRREGVVEESDRVRVLDRMCIDPGYVIFDRARQEVMARVVPELLARDVHLIGRYGAWTYSYMERAILDGLEIAERLRRR